MWLHTATRVRGIMLPIKSKTTEGRISLSNHGKRHILFSLSSLPFHGDAENHMWLWHRSSQHGWNCAELGLGLILVEFETVQLKTAKLLTPSTSARALCSKLAISWRGSWFRKENAAACLVLAAGKAGGSAKTSSTC